MKLFDLEKALGGDPFFNHRGEKSYLLKDLSGIYSDEKQPFIGYTEKDNGEITVFQCTLNYFVECNMWVEPRPTVTLTLPCPLKEPREGMYRLSEELVLKSSYKIDRPNGSYSKTAMDNGFYFATEEDAQAWANALKNNRE